MGPHIPISNNTGSLPDLTVLHFPSPLTTPLDAEDGSGAGYGGSSSPSSLSPTSPHHMAMPPPASQQSPVQRRRHVQPVPSPLVLNNTNQMHVPLSPPVSPGRTPWWKRACLCQSAQNLSLSALLGGCLALDFVWACVLFWCHPPVLCLYFSLVML